MMWFTIFLVVLFAVPDVKSDGDWYDYNYPGWYSNHNSRPRRRYRVMPTDPPVISTTPDDCAMDSVGNVKELLKIFSTKALF
ncbi:hypothetical protein HNY73_019009 [Argiope bruennichi]|uniref:Uncharacterized protein n=1 Tax=Argiope bruennichi TaxID=94029 RepID=A0A8T0EEU3_ARGBR|nr:hypothetical protein HNY73_019009 [Argiope bruennichi]